MDKTFKIGDIIKVSWFDDHEEYVRSSNGTVTMLLSMKKYIGKPLMIKQIDDSDNTVKLEYPHIDPDDDRLDTFWFHMNWLEDIRPEKKSIKISDLV